MIEESGLLNNVRVYAIAEKYSIFELKELAKTKFLSQVNSLISCNDFPEIIKMIYKSTPDSDRGLRNVVSDICTKQVRAFIDNRTFKEAVRDVGKFGLNVLSGALKDDDERLEQAIVQTLKDDDERLEQALAQKVVSEKKIIEGKVEIFYLRIDVNKARETLEEVITVVNRHVSCRQCSTDFNSRLNSENPRKLRCVKCDTIHR